MELGGLGPMLLVALCLSATGCPRHPALPPAAASASSADDHPDDTPVDALPAGATCGGQGDCSGDQVCVQGRCRYRHTSPGAEVLATAAKAQLDAGDFDGAVATFDKAIEAYDRAEAPVPAEVLCGAATAALHAAHNDATREAAARRADACFRGSMPGAPERIEVLRELSKLRYQGLDLALFDAEHPPQRFFTKKPTRPTLDAIEISMDVPDRDDPGYAQLADGLRGEAATRAIADCFIQDWDLRHESRAHASLVLQLQTQLRDMGQYDVYPPTVQVTATSAAQKGFEPCLAQRLTTVLEPGPRLNRVVTWQEPFEIAARLP